MRPAPWIIAALLLFATWRWYTHREIGHAPGILAADDPEQSELDDAAPILRGAFSLRPRADFHATVRILHREDYTFGSLAKLVP